MDAAINNVVERKIANFEFLLKQNLNNFFFNMK